MKNATLVLVRPHPERGDLNHPTDAALAERLSNSPPCWVVLIGGSPHRAGKEGADTRERHRTARHDAMRRALCMEGIAKDGVSVFAPVDVAGAGDADDLALALAGYLADVGLRMPLKQSSQLDVRLPPDLAPALLAAVVEAVSVYPRTDVWLGDQKLSSSLRWELRRDLFRSPSRVPSPDDAELLGSTPAIEEVRQKVARYADRPFPVLIIGETGTGKEVVAKMLHEQSSREGRFMAQNAAQLSQELADSLLFGHVKGAFTGADTDRHGRIREANGGTFFLDEVFNLAPPVQGKLLRALNRADQGIIHVEPLGSTREVPVNARLVVSALGDPRIEQQTPGMNAMRTDLFYRVSAGIICLPPLRQTLDDLPELCRAILHRLDHHGLVTDDGIAVLREHDWPGNIRELQLILLRTLMDAPSKVEELGPDALRAALDTNRLPPRAGSLQLPCDLDLELKRLEVATLRAALLECGHVQAQAGRRIGMDPKNARNFGRRLETAERQLLEMANRHAE
ncbi:MAG: sigma-54-dependent Fis family transcriptional regulator [Alphaproteobacteria bacterium]|nr:sigma-54-dependent Fis family transcriptional regulator [Alphaproteobacteria bacterium]